MKPITTCIVAGLQYLIHPQKLVIELRIKLNTSYPPAANTPKGSIQETINSDAIIPITLLTTDEVFGDLEGILQLFDTYDDVFTPDFGSILVEKPGGNSSEAVLGSRTRQIYHVDPVTILSDMAELPSGPYFLHGPNLHQAWRLYDDEFGAFAVGVIPDDLAQPDEFQPLTSSSIKGDSASIPVPSRLYRPRPSPRKPLSGVRISISDTISLKGTHTTFSSRAWISLYKEASSVTAEYARRLLDLGAVIVGKTKTAQFGAGAEWVDEQAPWSARGDRYGRVKGGSVGAEAAITGYDWLEYSIGVDDGRIAPEGGIYSLIPPSGSISTDFIRTTSSFDNARLFSRSLKGLMGITAKSLGDEHHEPTFPSKILYPVDLVSTGETQQDVLDAFVSALKEFLGVRVQDIDIGAIWAQNPPAEAGSEAMQAYMGHAPFRSWCYDYYHAFDQFRDQYREIFHREPFIEATPRFFWNHCESVTHAQHDDDTKRLEIYREWFHENIMTISSTPNAEPDAVLVLPCGNSSEVEHRDEPAAPPTILEGVKPDILAAILGAPYLAIPFTQVPYHSRISGRTEYQPVCVSLMGAYGSDISIIELARQALEKARVRTRVDTGRFAFPKDTAHFIRNDKDGQAEDLSDEL
ncbi:hypothetical protein ACJ41O_010596 [Fusarium nematophilum]